METSPIITRTDLEIRNHVKRWHTEGDRVALVPTMGALHKGHLSLIDFARQNAERIVVSIFVNPTQFGEGEDFKDYPRTWDDDIAALGKREVDAVYAPSANTMYPDGYATTVSVKGPALELETEFRPHFFDGVATVVSKLLLGVLPDMAVFGEKDYQQLLVIMQMVRDLQIPVAIKGAPTVREPDGLALSSRNAYLTERERLVAAKLYETLQDCASSIRGDGSPQNAIETAKRTLTQLGFDVDYVALRNADDLSRVASINGQKLRLLAAARLGTPRLIDNIAVD